VSIDGIHPRIFMTEPVLIERRGEVAVVTLNMPEKRNALGPALYQALPQILTELQHDDGLRALVLTGGKHFCSGGDLSGLDDPPLTMRRSMHQGQGSVRALCVGPLPVVAAVEGNAYGAGFSLAMACDFVIADEDTRFCASFARVGLTADYGLLWSLPQRVGIGVAREILMLGEPITGTQGKACGLVDRLSDKGEVLTTAIALAERLAKSAPGTIATAKSVLSRWPMGLDHVLAWEADTQSLLIRSEDFAEGVRAFKGRRPAKFTGR
jgi:2-(1,2-epoxy-1,2-dihydrophenyl)acetyl-CoA isomerase